MLWEKTEPLPEDGPHAARSPAASTSRLPRLPGPAFRLPLRIPVGPGPRQPCARMRAPQAGPGPGGCAGPSAVPLPSVTPRAHLTLQVLRELVLGGGEVQPQRPRARTAGRFWAHPPDPTPTPTPPHVCEPVTPAGTGTLPPVPSDRSTADATWTNRPHLPETSALCPCRTSAPFSTRRPAGPCP